MAQRSLCNWNVIFLCRQRCHNVNGVMNIKGCYVGYCVLMPIAMLLTSVNTLVALQRERGISVQPLKKLIQALPITKVRWISYPCWDSLLNCQQRWQCNFNGLLQDGEWTDFKPFPDGPFCPPCPTALGLIGPRKKEKKSGFDDVG